MAVLTDGWTCLKPNTRPFRWLATWPGALIPLEAAHRLAETFPVGSYVRRDTTGRTSDKHYRNFSRPVTGTDDPDLPALWRELVADLLRPDYRHQVARLLDQPVAAALELRLVRHTAGDWLGPHTDRADKMFSHILYFNAGWPVEWGGCLQILGSDDSSDVVEQVVPELGASALIARSDASWHQVSAVAAHPVPERLSLLVHGLHRSC